jgi:hypothetical protein
MLNAAPDTPAGPVTVGHLLFLLVALMKELIQMDTVWELEVQLDIVVVKDHQTAHVQSQEELLVNWVLKLKKLLSVLVLGGRIVAIGAVTTPAMTEGLVLMSGVLTTIAELAFVIVLRNPPVS